MASGEHVLPEDQGGHDKLIRKFRKKLRQIERLELLNRALSEDEAQKVESKGSVRQQLQLLLSQVSENEESKDTYPSFSSHETQEDEINLNTSEISNHDSIADVSGGGDVENKKLQEETQFERKSNEDTSEKSQKMKPEKGSDKDKRKTVSDKIPKERFDRLYKGFMTSVIQVTILEGHSDIITAVAVHEDIIITASRDTTLKCWSLETGLELRSLGSHTESVTSLTVLAPADCLHAFPDSADMHQEPIIISGSWDCTVKLWEMKSDGGKLELWDLSQKINVFSTRAYDAAVIGIKVEENTRIYSCAADGTIQVHDGSEKGNLKRLFVSDDLRSPSGKPFNLSHIRCLEVWNGQMLIGQDTSNIKLVDWKKGTVEKLKNHPSQFSFSDAICCHNDTVMTSSYDLDNGLGCLNVRCGPSLKYSGTFDDEETERILCIDFVRLSSGNMTVVSGGTELKVWKIFQGSHPRPSSQENMIGGKFYPSLSEPAVDSDSEDDDDDDDSDYDEDNTDGESSEAEQSDLRHQGSPDSQNKASWWSWCSVL